MSMKNDAAILGFKGTLDQMVMRFVSVFLE